MPRFAVIALLVTGLCGCATLEGNGPDAQARRAAFVHAHPGNDYNTAILMGQIMTGMSREEVTASQGDNCTIEGASNYGYSMRCHTTAQDLAYDPGTLVLFDNTGHVTSWSD